MIRRWRLGTPTLFGAVAASCLLLEAIQAQEIKAPTTLVPLPLIKAMANEVSGALAFANVLEIVPYERDRPAEEYGAGTFREAAYMAAKAREYGLSEVRIERFPQAQMEWDGEVAELWVEKPVRKLVTSYRDITATLARGSRSADVTGPLVYVGAGDRESDYAGKAVTGAIVLARGPIGVVHDLAVRKFGAAGVASFHNPVGSPIERPDQIPWTSLTPVAAGAGIPGSQPRTTFGFALSLRMGLELLELLDRSGDVVVRARVATREHAAELQVVVGTIPGDGSLEPPDKTELIFSGHLFEGIAKQGANDNAAGPVVQLEMARAWVKLIADGVLPPSEAHGAVPVGSRVHGDTRLSRALPGGRGACTGGYQLRHDRGGSIEEQEPSAPQLCAIQPAVVRQRRGASVPGLRRRNQPGAEKLQAWRSVRPVRPHRRSERLARSIPVSVRQILRRQRPRGLHRGDSACAGRRVQHLPRCRLSHERRQPFFPRSDADEAIRSDRTLNGASTGERDGG